ncbi:hypothetical protein C5748_12855 [Phyllobacterium phragmitis]|uniref:Uncharacterized protein n=1 Tax=Phyllobacterium phragmitis TaxID=2670329 RepID=A0A2S9IRF0_9HYPH|nr:hypothetical protein C5748_12855 [Phyllobacterium phragmitis]
MEALCQDQVPSDRLGISQLLLARINAHIATIEYPILAGVLHDTRLIEKLQALIVAGARQMKPTREL